MAEGKVTSLADIVYERVEEDILTGAYQRGDVLTELKLSEKLNVSRTPVREALRRLEQDRDRLLAELAIEEGSSRRPLSEM